MKLPTILTPVECGQLVRSASNLKERALLQLMYDGALRLAEVCQVRVADIKDGQLHVHEGKGAKDRIVPLMDGTIDILRQYWTRYRPGKGAAYLFRSESQYAKYYAPRTLQRIVEKAAVRAGIGQRVYPHLIRHSRATHLLNAGMSIYDLAMLLGHANIETTTIYLHTATERLAEVKAEAARKVQLQMQD